MEQENGKRQTTPDYIPGWFLLSRARFALARRRIYSFRQSRITFLLIYAGENLPYNPGYLRWLCASVRRNKTAGSALLIPPSCQATRENFISAAPLRAFTAEHKNTTTIQSVCTNKANLLCMLAYKSTNQKLFSSSNCRVAFGFIEMAVLVVSGKCRVNNIISVVPLNHRVVRIRNLLL